MEHPGFIPYIQGIMPVVLMPGNQPFPVPGNIAVLPEKKPAHIIVDTCHGETFFTEKINGFRTDQPAGTGDYRH
jgi:hypothetical protein